MKLGKNILRICDERKMSLTQLALKSGVPIQTLHGWTTGKSVANLNQLKKVASCLEYSFHELVFGEIDPFETKSEEVLKEIFSGDIRVSLHRIDRKRGR